MKLVELITIRLEQLPSLGWLQLVTDEGIVGLGESCLHLDAVGGYLHEVAAPRLLGHGPRDIERHARRLYDSFTGWGGSGAETKGNSAVDVALWDILGQSVGEPLYRLLGGQCRESIRTYNTCAGPWYGQVRAAEPIHNWNLPTDGVDLSAYEDLAAFLNRADELAENLLSEGLTAMKIWPFDSAALAHDGLSISAQEMRDAIGPIAQVRAAVELIAKVRAADGDRMDIMVERQALWKPGTARAIARALEEYEPYWVEDA